jgi:hypothetical protein
MPRTILRVTRFHSQHHQPKQTDCGGRLHQCKNWSAHLRQTKGDPWTIRHCAKQCLWRKSSPSSCCPNPAYQEHFFHHRHDKYVTFTSLPTTHHPHRIPSMYDIFACSTSLHKQVHNCQMVLHGVASDHQAVWLKIALASVKYKVHVISKGTIDRPKLLSCEHT